MSVAEVLGVHEDVGQGGDGGLVFSIGFEDFGSRLYFFVVSRQGLLDQFDDVIGRGVGELGCVYLHCKC